MPARPTPGAACQRAEWRRSAFLAFTERVLLTQEPCVSRQMGASGSHVCMMLGFVKDMEQVRT